MRIITLIGTWLTLEVVVVAGGNKPKKCIKDGVDMCKYKNHGQMISRFEDIEMQYPDIAKVENIIKIDIVKAIISEFLSFLHSRLDPLGHL